MKKLICVLCTLLIVAASPLFTVAAESPQDAAALPSVEDIREDLSEDPQENLPENLPEEPQEDLQETSQEAIQAVLSEEPQEDLQDELPAAVSLPVQTILQKPELPNGCEITAATIVLNYLGYTVDKCTLADTYLPRTASPYGTDPELAYMGNPHSGSRGWYCFTAPIVSAMNDFLRDSREYDMTAKDLTGIDAAGLRGLLDEGRPVVFWGTIGFAAIRRGGITLPNGSSAYTNLHCMACIGYTENSYLIADPLGVCSEVDAATFEAIYDGMGRRAVAVMEGTEI